MHTQTTMKKISPEKFLFEIYIARVGFAVNQVIDEFDTPKKGFTVLGYCDANRLKVRPRTEGYALMLESEDGEKFWLHVERLHGLKKPPAPSIKKPLKDVDNSTSNQTGSYTMEQFNKAYCEFRMEKMGNKKQMEDLKGIMRAYRSLLHIYINTVGMEKEEMVRVMMQGLQVEFGLRMTYAHGPMWPVKALEDV